AAEEAARAATATVVAAAAAARAAGMMHALVVGIVGGNDAGRDDLREQRLVLELVQIAGGGIVARGLPALEHATGCFIEPAVDPGVEAEAVEAALHVAALAFVETDLAFRNLIGFLCEGRGVDASGQVAGDVGGTILQRGDSGQRQRLELAVGIA